MWYMLQSANIFLVVKVPTHGSGMEELQLARTCIRVGGVLDPLDFRI